MRLMIFVLISSSIYYVACGSDDIYCSCCGEDDDRPPSCVGHDLCESYMMCNVDAGEHCYGHVLCEDPISSVIPSFLSTVSPSAEPSILPKIESATTHSSYQYISIFVSLIVIIILFFILHHLYQQYTANKAAPSNLIKISDRLYKPLAKDEDDELGL